ncbi:hypothetical protein GQ457_01G028610 [Hibiscus cannabinus]
MACMPRKNVFACHSLIHGYARNGDARKAVEVFKESGSSGDAFLLAAVIGACVDLGAIEYGKQIHAHMVVGGIEFGLIAVILGTGGSLCISEHVEQMQHGHANKAGVLQAYDTILLNSMITVLNMGNQYLPQ